MNNLEISDLGVVLALVEEGGFAGAAKRLGISQPAVSLRIAKLEGEFGFRLFRRRPDGTEITRHGRELLPLIAEIEMESDRLRRRASYWKRATGGEVRIVADGSILSQKIRAELEFLPNYTGVIWEDLTPMGDWRDCLVGYEADLVLAGSFMSSGDSEGVSTAAIRREKGMTCAWNPDYFGLSANGFDLKSAVSSEVILPAESMCPGFREFLYSWCESTYGIFLDDCIEAETEAGAVDLCQQGLGVLLVPGNASERLALRERGLDTASPFGLLLPDSFTFGLRYRTDERSPALLAAIRDISDLCHSKRMSGEMLRNGCEAP